MLLECLENPLASDFSLICEVSEYGTTFLFEILREFLAI
jgi:hypothetical protein